VKPKERNHLTEEDLANGYRMACQTFIVKGEVSVSWEAKKQAPQPAIDREGLILARQADRPQS
jgi:hypothetical protein